MASPAVYMQVGSQQKVGATKTSITQKARDLNNATKNRELAQALQVVVNNDVHTIEGLQEENKKLTKESAKTPARPWYQSCTIT